MGKRDFLARHGNEPADDRIVTWLGREGFEIDSCKPFDGDLLGEPEEDLVGTVIYAGNFNVYETDRHRFLNQEYRWIETGLGADIPMLGICQGAQHIAYHLGAWAGAPETECFEFGYYRVDPEPSETDFMAGPLSVTQAHYHTFDLPKGATRLASNDNYANQAFRYGNKVYGLQFHPGVTVAGFRRWQKAKWGVYGRPGVQSREELTRLMNQHDPAQADWFHGFLGRLF